MEMTIIIRAIKSSNARVSCREDMEHMTKLWWSFSPGTWTSRPGISALRVSSTMAAHPYSQPQLLHLQRGGTWANGGGSRVSHGETLPYLRIGKIQNTEYLKLVWEEHSFCGPGSLTCVHLYGRLGVGQVLRAT